MAKRTSSGRRSASLPGPFYPILLVALLAPFLVTEIATARQDREAAETATDEPDERFFEALTVNVVNVEVVVTDEEGRPVTGLGKEDFELYEDGQPVEITNFYAVGGAPASTAPSRRADENRDAGDAARATATLPPPRAGRPDEQRLNLVVFVDNLFLSPLRRNHVMREVERFLHAHVRPDDRLMLVTFDRSLHIRQPFTSDIGLIRDALEELTTATAFGAQAQTERRDLLERIEGAAGAQEALSHADFYAKSVHNDLESSLRALDELVSSLSGLPGRKALLHVSEGLPLTPGEDAFAMVGAKFGQRAASQLRANRYREHRRFRQLVSQANASRVTFYTIDAAGGYTNTSLSAESGRIRSSTVEADFTYDASRQAPLEILAQGTGGRSVVGTANYRDALNRIGRDLSTYYSLGFVTAHSGDGRYHTLEVKVKRRDVDVLHREGYRSRSAETKLYDGTLAALLYEVSVNPLGVELVFGRPRSGQDGQYLLPIEVRIPLDKVALVPRGEEHRGQLRVSMSVMDGDGDTSPPSQEPFTVVVPKGELESAKDRYYSYTAQLLMRPGTHRVAVGVTDEVAGESSFLQQPVSVEG